MKKKSISLRGIQEILSMKELKNTLGGSGGSSPIVSYECCVEGEPDNCIPISGPCAGPDCETCKGYGIAQSGYNCKYLGCTYG